MRPITQATQQVALFASALAVLVAFTSLMDSSVLMDGDPSVGWFNMIHLEHNSFIPWRFGHLTQALLAVFPVATVAEKPVAPLAILLLGTSLVVSAGRSSLSLSTACAPLYALIPCALLLDVVGIDPLVIGSACWIPLIAIVASYLMAAPNSTILWIVLAALSVENSFNANQVALLSGTLALGLAYVLYRHSHDDRTNPGDTWIWLALVILAPAAVTLLITPLPFLPKYPKSAHVVPFSNLEGYIKPLVGPAYPFDSIDRQELKRLYSFGALIVSSLAATLYLLVRIRLQSFTRYIVTTGLILAVIACMDTRLPEEWAMISPIASISRLLPLGTTYALTSIALGLSAWCLGFAVAIANYKRSLVITLIAGLVLLLYGPRELYHPYLRSSGLLTNEKIAAIARTPSASIIRLTVSDTQNIDAWLDQVGESAKLPIKDAKSLGATVSISPAPSHETLAAALQVEHSFRWSTRTGQQRGNEVLTIQFPSPISMRGIELDPGTYATDYPRGLTIRGGDCSAQHTAPVLFEAPIWQGALRLTSKGVPYFSPCNDVHVVFTSEATVQCLFAQQTAKAPFDWSVTRVGVIVHK